MVPRTRPRGNGQSVLAQVSLSYLTPITTFGGGALVHSDTPPFGPDAECHRRRRD
ncbi:MAG: hypothetical protein LC796_15140 [Acidobacteria bacterium]|nr:hypothetical protein [Acidobacteriota bacterium]MCA1612077.1 hypothetical protein [Acidobacteriota bacterium]